MRRQRMKKRREQTDIEVLSESFSVFGKAGVSLGKKAMPVIKKAGREAIPTLRKAHESIFYRKQVLPQKEGESKAMVLFPRFKKKSIYD